MNEDENIIKISNQKLKRILVQKRLEKICNCKNRYYVVDFQQRLIQCEECGAYIDPFEVIKDFMDMENYYWSQLRYLQSEKEELEKWMLNNRLPKQLKEYASRLRQGLVPICPTCNKPFDIQNITQWVSVDYAKRMLEEDKDNGN